MARITVGIENVCLQLTRSVNRSARVMRIFVEPWHDIEFKRDHLRKNTVFPGLRTVQAIARKHLRCTPKQLELVMRLNSSNYLAFDIPTGRTVEQRTMFLAAIATKTKVRKRIEM